MKRKSIRKIFNLIALGALACIVIEIVGCTPSEHEIKSKVVRIHSEHGMCSGEQITAPSGQSYILTASHCKLLGHDGSYSVTTEDGLQLERKLVAEDPRSDLLLLEGLPNVKGLKISDSSWSQEEVRGFTHGRNHDTYISKGEILEVEEAPILVFPITSRKEAARCTMPKNKDINIDTISGSRHVCLLDTFETVTTVSIAPGSSGGPVVDYSGELVGVVSASDGQGFGFLVTLHDIKSFLSGY